MSDCPHCVDGCIHGVCRVCPCPACSACRPCRTCLAWIGRLGAAIRPQLAQVAADRGCTVDEARAEVLAAYHRHHQEVSDE